MGFTGISIKDQCVTILYIFCFLVWSLFSLVFFVHSCETVLWLTVIHFADICIPILFSAQIRALFYPVGFFRIWQTQRTHRLNCLKFATIKKKKEEEKNQPGISKGNVTLTNIVCITNERWPAHIAQLNPIKRHTKNRQLYPWAKT